MSTRCQVKVVQSGLEWEQAITLYHHCDGYPTGMLPLFVEAWENALKYLVAEANRFGFGPTHTVETVNTWELGRAGKAAAFLCYCQPDQFEPEEGHKRHGDIEWYYTLYCNNLKGGTIDDKCSWEVEVEDVYKGKVVLERTPIRKAAKMAEDVERQGEE